MVKHWLAIGLIGMVSSAPVYSDTNLHGTILHGSTKHALTTMVGVHPLVAISGILLVLGIVVYRYRKSKDL